MTVSLQEWFVLKIQDSLKDWRLHTQYSLSLVVYHSIDHIVMGVCELWKFRQIILIFEVRGANGIPCSRRLYISTIRATLLSPSNFLFGIYPIWAFPTNGTRWCSQREKISIFLTITISSWSSSKTAPLINSVKLFLTLGSISIERTKHWVVQSNFWIKKSDVGRFAVRRRSPEYGRVQGVDE